jgi:hypothetical protein
MITMMLLSVDWNRPVWVVVIICTTVLLSITVHAAFKYLSGQK